MDDYKLLDCYEKLPHGYRLLTVEEALNHTEEVTKILAHDIAQSQKFENVIQEIHGFKLQTIIDVLYAQKHIHLQSSEITEIIKETSQNTTQDVDYSLQNTLERFLVYKEYGRKRNAGILAMEFIEMPSIEDIPDISKFTLETVLQKGRKSTFSLNQPIDTPNKVNKVYIKGILNLEFVEVEISKQDDYDDDDDNEVVYHGGGGASASNSGGDDNDDKPKDKKGKEEDMGIQTPFKIYESRLDEEIPMGYRLATLEELLLCVGNKIKFLVKKTKIQLDAFDAASKILDVWLMLRRSDVLREGKDRDIQDFFGTYFYYDELPTYEHPKLRLKNGFIDLDRRLVWKQFTKHFILQQLAVRWENNIANEMEPKVEDQVVALLFACFLDSHEEIKDIIKDPNFFEIVTKNHINAPREGCALHLCAAEEGMVESLKLLMSGFKDPIERTKAYTTKADWDEETPLYLAMLRGQERVVKILCVSDNVNERTKEDKNTVLMIAAKYQMENTKLWRPILDRKELMLNITNQRKDTVFHVISYYTGVNFDSSSHATLLKELIEKCGCKVSYKAYEVAGKDTIEPAIIEDVASLYRENVKHTCDNANESHYINLMNDRNSTPLHLSLGVRELPRDNLNDDTGTYYDEASLSSPPRVEAIPIQFSRLLISAGADIHAIDMQGQHALHRACTFPNDLCTIKILLQCFLDRASDKSSRYFKDAKRAWFKYSCTRDFFGQTPLHLAAKSGNQDAVHLLLDLTYNPLVDEILIDKLIKMRDFNDKTIFHFVASRPDPFTIHESIKLEIVKYTCDPLISGRVLPLLMWSVAERIGLADEVAKASGYYKLAKFLRTKRRNCTENLLKLALHLEQYDMVVELINRGAIITKDIQHDAQMGDFKKELKYWDDKLKHAKDEESNTCAKLGKSCLAQLYEARKAQVLERIKKSKKDKYQLSLAKLKVLEQIHESHLGRTTDQPTSEDLLERKDITSSISALLLNQHMGSPITLGILGGTGMGKSSMMLQVEHNLLSKAARETISLALPTSSGGPKEQNMFTGAKKDPDKSKRRAERLLNELEMVIWKVGHKRKSYHSFEEAIDLKKLKDSEKARKGKGWFCLLPEYIFKGLKKVKSLLFSTFECKSLSNEIPASKVEDYISNFNEGNMWVIKRLALANDGKEVPSLLTVRYNAWQYETRDEAWAGLAVAILKEMESCMTKAHLFYASVMYSYKKNPSNARVQLIIPIILYLVIGGIVGWVSFTLLSIPKSPLLASFKYGSIPICVLASIWQVLSQVAAYAKPISDKFIETTKSLQEQHLSKVGYQHQVIEDINFLRDRMTSKVPMLCLWRLGAFILNTSSGSTFLANQMEASDALKYTPQGENFRIIVFIDNLDRQKEKLFTPLNMILKSCDINAVVAIDKGSVEDVIEATDEQPRGKKEKGEPSLLKDTLLQQLIQIPIVLPEPDLFELRNSFLKKHLKDMKKTKKVKSKPSSDNPLDSKQDMDQGSSSMSQDDEGNDSDDEQKSTHNSTMANAIEIATSDSNNSIEIKDGEGNGSDDEQKSDYNSTMVNGIVTPTLAWLEMKVNVLDSNYSRGEIKIFKHLVNHTYGYYRSPRAWKSLLNYHRLIRSLITYNYQYVHMSGWKRQLIIWVFFCWQWREQMNEIFKNWESLTSFPLRELEYNNLLVSEQHNNVLIKILESELQMSLLKEKRHIGLWDSINIIYPSLLKIIQNQKKRISQNTAKEENQPGTSSGELEMKNAAKGDPNDAHQEEGQDQSLRFKENDKNVHWERLSKALIFGGYDVTMQGIQIFQKYRFDCEVGTLKMHTIPMM